MEYLGGGSALDLVSLLNKNMIIQHIQVQISTCLFKNYLNSIENIVKHSKKKLFKKLKIVVKIFITQH